MDVSTQMWMQDIVAEERGRLLRWQAAWTAYFGTGPSVFKTDKNGYNDSVAVNYARLIVDKAATFLFGQEPQFELGDESDESPAEQWLHDCWRANRKMQLLQKLAINGGVCGHVFLKIAPPTTPGGFPRLINLSPEYVTVVCDPDDIDLVWRYIIEYPARGKDGEQLTMRQTIERDAGQTWTVTDEISVRGGRWQTTQAIVWPYSWPPIIDCQNLPSPNEYYGIADVEEDVIKLNHSINFTLSNLQRIIRYHAHPKTWGRGFNSKELQIGIDETIILNNPEAELHNLEMQSDLTSSIEFYKRLKEALHEVTRVPEVATGKLDSSGALSGVALQILYQPLIEKIEAKRLTYGEMLIELNRRLLEMAGYGPDNLVTLHWPELLPKNRLEELQAALLEKQIGVSADTTLRRLGLDPDLEKAKQAAEGADMAEQLLTAFDRGQ